NVNLIDQNEWCTIEILQDDATTVRINGVPVLTVSDMPAIGNDITVTTDANSEVHIRQAHVK
ncbi:MAG: hypothetical protein H8D52_04825, partial [Gammaproteobacteria bacterium]|nr:hypothetical protein [Gammaproteobacteria bacterium]